MHLALPFLCGFMFQTSSEIAIAPNACASARGVLEARRGVSERNHEYPQKGDSDERSQIEYQRP